MKNLPTLFLGIFFALAFSWTGLILSSHLFLGDLKSTTATLDEQGNPVEGDPLYPLKLSGIAREGKQVYIDGVDEHGKQKGSGRGSNPVPRV